MRTLSDAVQNTVRVKLKDQKDRLAPDIGWPHLPVGKLQIKTRGVDSLPVMFSENSSRSSLAGQSDSFVCMLSAYT